MPWANVNGTTLHYEVTGPESGKPIVCIHPPLLTLETFVYQKEQLSKQFRVITFDIRGHGGSAPTEQPLKYPLIAEDITSLLDYLGIEHAYLCGYSTGGAIVLEAMLMHPSRFSGGIIVSGMSELTDLRNRGRVWLAIQMARSSRFMKLLIEAVTHGNADKSITYQKLKAQALHDSVENVKSYYEQSLNYNCTSRLPAIDQPVLLIYGQGDPTFHPYAHLLHRQLPHSSLYFIRHAKHQIPFHRASRMNELIHLWLDSLDEHQKDREKLDLAIAQRLNPLKYGPFHEPFLDGESVSQPYE